MVLDLGACSLLFDEVDPVFTAILAAITLVSVGNRFAVGGAQTPTVFALSVFVDLELGHCFHHLLWDNLAFGAVY